MYHDHFYGYGFMYHDHFYGSVQPLHLRVCATTTLRVFRPYCTIYGFSGHTAPFTGKLHHLRANCTLYWQTAPCQARTAPARLERAPARLERTRGPGKYPGYVHTGPVGTHTGFGFSLVPPLPGTPLPGTPPPGSRTADHRARSAGGNRSPG